MLIRPKLFLTFAVLCISPLLILSLINFRSGIVNTELVLRHNLEGELSDVSKHYDTMLEARDDELRAVASGPLPSFVRSARTPEAVALIDPIHGSMASGVDAEAANAVRKAIIKLPLNGYYADLACFDYDNHLLFLVQLVPNGQPTFRTKDFLPGGIEADHRVWLAHDDTPLCSPVSHPLFGDVLRCSLPIFLTPDEHSNSPRGVLVAEIRSSELFANVDAGSANEHLRLTRRIIVWDSAGKIVYHQNNALRNQPIANVLPGFAPIAAAIASGKDVGLEEFHSVDGEKWIAAYEPLGLGLGLAVARNYSLATQPARRAGWLGIGLSILFGLAGATLLTFLYQRKTQSIDRVKQSVAALAKGEFDQELLLRSSDDLRSVADNVNLMTARLREQVAREAEEHQFQSFIKLAAVLTHDLKNAIAGLSLMVDNIEGNFDDPQFRADAMKGLTSAANKLRGLVARLSNPVNTLSGEFKPPRSTDLVPLLQRVAEGIADPLSGTHEIEVRLPPSLVAMADAERIERVMENLVLNAVEAMAGKRGKLTITAGAATGDKVFFSVSDTGAGMTPAFIQQRLFHPFATTKASGVGLGLYTCREVVRANGGTIEVESKEGSGTTFRVVLASAPITERES